MDSALDQERVGAQPSPYCRMKSEIDAAAITAVADQPQIAVDRDSVSRPITLGLRAISIMRCSSPTLSTALC